MGMENMGKPIPADRREIAYQVARKEFGMERDEAFSVVELIAGKLERDQPYEAMQEAMKRRVDLTGIYRLFAHLLTDATADNRR